MKLLIKTFLVGLIITSSMYAAPKGHELTVIASGESHGMLEDCDCVQDPGGGMAQRSFMIKTLGNRQDKLLLDVGGFAAGDLYDSYTEGRVVDSIRTIAMIKAMGIIGYDAVGIGDDDLQYGGKWLLEQAKSAKLLLISANCFYQNGTLLTKPYLLVKKGQVTYGITALTSNENLIATDKSIDIKDPNKSLESIWKEILQKSDVQIILSHLGQEKSNELARLFPECDLIINGHRKSDNEPIYTAGAIPVMQFGFQGKSLSQGIFNVSDNSLELLKSSWIQIHQNLPLDTIVSDAIKYDNLPRNSVYDLYIMSHCPYGTEALSDFLSFQRSFPSVQWEIRFIGTVENDGSFNSLHGEAEVNDEMVWLAIKELYPEKWLEFLTIRSKMPVPAIDIPEFLHIDKQKIEQWIIKNGKSALSGHYRRSSRLAINASPTLLINNLPYDGQIVMNHLSRNACTQAGNISTYCDSIPACIENIDCKKKGMIGRCVADTCEFRDAVHFNFTILVNDSLNRHPEDAIIETTEDLFPGAEISKISIYSVEGKKLLEKWEFPPLPFYLFDKNVNLTPNFSSIESGLTSFSGGYTFKPGVSTPNYFPSRKEKKGEIVFYIDPFFTGISAVLDVILSKPILLKQSTFNPITFSPPDKVTPGTLDQFRQDEALRWLVINKQFKDRMGSYLHAYMSNYGTSFWYDNVESAGIDHKSISGISADKKRELLQEHNSLLQELEIKEPFAVLVDNRELIYVGNEKLLKEFVNGE